MIVYTVVENDYDGTLIFGSYSKKTDAEVHLNLEKKQAELKGDPTFYFEIQELEVSSETPRLFYAHKIESDGVSTPSSIVRIGTRLPATFTAEEPLDPHMGYPKVEAYGWTPEEALLKAEAASRRS